MFQGSAARVGTQRRTRHGGESGGGGGGGGGGGCEWEEEEDAFSGARAAIETDSPRRAVEVADACSGDSVITSGGSELW